VQKFKNNATMRRKAAPRTWKNSKRNWNKLAYQNKWFNTVKQCDASKPKCVGTHACCPMSCEMNSNLSIQFGVPTAHAQARATLCRNRLALLSVFELNNRDFVTQSVY
jgi:hypothetical protein